MKRAVVQDVAAAVPELLAPAGDGDALRAAVANGADAVYFGLQEFNARHRATNFATQDLPELMAYLRGHNVRGYVTLNTLIFSDELPRIAEQLRALAQAGVDAVIVQDIGLVRLIRALTPGLAVHGSTQMTLTEPRGIEMVGQLGVERVVIARESSLDDIRRMRQRTAVELECFVHGALCVSYSGQCLTSESLGGRSANRGQCAQACRLPYELVVDGEQRDLGEKAYLLSPQDLAAADLVADLAQLGVASLKIEGRLKSAQYVAAATGTYRAALDAASQGRGYRPSPEQQEDLTQSFSRGFSHGFLAGVDHQTLVQGRFPKHRGVHAGAVVGVPARGVRVELEPGVELKPGDGVVFDEGHPEQDEQGGRIAAVNPQPTAPQPGGGKARRVELVMNGGAVNLRALHEGARVWRTDDPTVRRRLERTYARDRVPRRLPVHASLAGAPGEPLKLTLSCAGLDSVEVQSPQPLEAAQRHPLTAESAREQLSRMGDSAFELQTIEVLGPGGELPVLAPRSVLNDMRRRAVSLLEAQREARAQRGSIDDQALDRLRAQARRFTAPAEVRGDSYPPDAPGLCLLVRQAPQLEAAIDWHAARRREGQPGLRTLYAEYEDVRAYGSAVAAARRAGVPIALATTRVIKPSEDGLIRQVAACGPDAVLVRNLAALALLREERPGLPLIGDYSLNISNELTADYFAQLGLHRAVPSFDLNWPQLAQLLAGFDARWFEAVVHQHMPMFHMEHCVFCATLSTGKDHRDCGRPCDRHEVSLRDRAGADNPLVADVGCRNTVYNAVAQSAAEYIPRMLQAGVRRFRVELLRDRPDEVGPLLDRYERVVTGREDPRRTWRQLQVLNQLGVTRGTLAHE